METMLISIIALAVLFLLVIFNNKRNIKKKRNLKTNSFREDYFKKKREKEKEISNED